MRKLSNVFYFKDCIPKELTYTAADDISSGLCNETYCEETIRHFRTLVPVNTQTY